MSNTTEKKSVWERTPDARYREDAKFRQLVDTMEAHMHAADFTPTEMREAALLAAINYESRRVRHLHGYTMSAETANRCYGTIDELYRAIQTDEPFNHQC